jgi:hypothetical protein
MKRSIFVAGACLAVLSGTAAAHSDVGFSFSIGVPGAVYSAPPPAYYAYGEPYYAPPRVYYNYGGRDWERHRNREYREHRRHEEREHWQRGHR